MSEMVAAPDDQLRRIETFKCRIRPTTFYKDFEDETVLQEEVEEALADWVYKRVLQRPGLQPPPIVSVSARDLNVLLSLLGPTRPAGEPLDAPIAEEDRQLSLQRLSEAGIITRTDTVTVMRDLQSFLYVSNRFLSSSHAVRFLSTRYYEAMVRDHLPTIVRERYHAVLDPTALEEIRILVGLAPRAARETLFGDTTRYDTLFAHVGHNEALRGERWRMVGEFLAEAALLSVAQDMQFGNTVTHLHSTPFAAKVLAIKVAGAFLDGLAFEVEHHFPMIAARAGTNAEAGQVAFGRPELIASSGLAFLHLGECEVAVRSFDQALTGDLSAEARAATLNNRGLARLRLGNQKGGIADFQAALQINPELISAQQNLATAQAAGAQ
jgi:tetratricopeptide (TPR) repeat protein